MDYYAVNALKESFQKTKNFFFGPFSLKRWLKLGFVGILGGIAQQAGGSCNCNSPGGGGGGSSSGSDGTSSGDTEFANQAKEAAQNLEHFYKEHSTLIFALAGLLILLILVLSIIFQYIRANMFFVFMESLIQREVTITSSFGNNKGKGFSLFSFRLVIGLISLIIIVVASIPLIIYLWKMTQSSSPNWNIWSIVANFFLTIVTILIVAIISHCIMSPTHDFATAIAYGKDMSILGAWSYLSGLMTANPLQFFVYYIMKILVSVCVGFAMLILLVPVTIILLIVYIILALILALVGVGVYFLYTFSPVLGVIATLLGVLILVVIIMAMGYVFFCPFLPIYAFFRYYPLCFLEKIDGSLNFSEPYLGNDDTTGGTDSSFSY